MSRTCQELRLALLPLWSGMQASWLGPHPCDPLTARATRAVGAEWGEEPAPHGLFSLDSCVPGKFQVVIQKA